MFLFGQSYLRRELHAQYGGQRQGGICTPKDFSFILLFTGESGNRYGYSDGWVSPELFLYTGEGQRGDMQFVRGNRAIRDHIQDGRDLHLFEYVRAGTVKYTGQMVCIGHQELLSLDLHGRQRRAIVFELTPVNTTGIRDFSRAELEWDTPLEELRRRALESATPNTPTSERIVHVHLRAEAIRLYALKRANGVCELCGKQAPFIDKDGRPYLEAHHLRRLSDGGPDDPEWVAGICPNCHRQTHYGNDAET
ncbi:MAG: HNH endonuclease, partial [candidate division Zixibacteria bacterium]|nr:HNH endonuclease [candidate division Zixibacteria bacterium]